MKKLNQNGSHLVALVLGLLVVAVVGFAGYRVLSDNTSAPVATTPTSSATVSQPKAITSRAQLNQAAQSLDSSTSDLNNSLDSNDLNSSLNTLL